MENTSILAAVISGGLTLIAPIATLFFTRMYDQRDLRKIKGRRAAFDGVWKGKIQQILNDEPIEIGLSATFSTGKKLISGKIKLDIKDQKIEEKIPYEITLAFTGGFHYEQFLKIDYSNANDEVMQFGSMVLSLSSDSKTLSGKYVGYGSVSGKIINGDITLTK